MSDPLPPADKIAEISKLDVLDKDGNKVAFGSLIGSTGTTIIVFIRHFCKPRTCSNTLKRPLTAPCCASLEGCGKCKLYIEALSEPDKAAALSAASVKLVVVGCGSWQPIKGYISSVVAMALDGQGRCSDANTLTQQRHILPVRCVRRPLYVGLQGTPPACILFRGRC